MRICRVVNNFKDISECTGDITPLFYHQSRYLVKMGYDVHIVCGRSKDQREYEIIDGIHVHRVAPIINRRSYLYGEFAQKCFAKVKELDPEIIHGDTSVHFGCVWNKRKLLAPIITQPHAILDAYKYMDYLPLSYNLKEALMYGAMVKSYFYENKYILNNSNYIIAVSNACKDSIKRYVDTDFITVIHNGVDMDGFRKIKVERKLSVDIDNIILFTGRPVPLKGIQYLIEATKRLNRDFESLNVLLVGTNRKDMPLFSSWILDCIKKSKLINILPLSEAKQNELKYYYSVANCFVLPSTTEACSLSLLEAQSCECPIVASDVGGNPEMLGDESGLLFKSKDSNDLYEKISFVLNHKNGFDGREFVKDFTWEKSAEKLSKLYEEIYIMRTMIMNDRFKI